jgi:hypothetical protein
MHLQIETITTKDGGKLDVIRDIEAVRRAIAIAEKGNNTNEKENLRLCLELTEALHAHATLTREAMEKQREAADKMKHVTACLKRVLPTIPGA